MHYYYKKYPFYYDVSAFDGRYTYFTVPVKTLVALYHKKTGQTARSFFDCGCANGELLRQAENMGLCAKGIDIKRFPMNKSKNIQITSLSDYNEPIAYDIAFCNGTLTYMNEKNIDAALTKLAQARLLIAIHNTVEDDEAAGYRLSSKTEPRLIKNRQWWVNKMTGLGFDASYDATSDCFLALSRAHIRS